MIHKKFKAFIDYLNSLTLKDRDLYEQYAMMKNAASVLDERIKELSEMIVGEMSETIGVEKQTFKYGTFSLTHRKSYTYSDKVKEKEEQLKALKKKEEESGKAKVEIKTGLLFRG